MEVLFHQAVVADAAVVVEVVQVVAVEAVAVVEIKNMNRLLPNYITFQWHLTDQCNFRCKHCYQTDYTNNGESLMVLTRNNFV